uniref:Lysophosphatidylcholine acyltransferase 1 n=2 Tax=Macaca mulatta TaxID=9544 RepID=A0A5F8AF02_MACMU
MAGPWPEQPGARHPGPGPPCAQAGRVPAPSSVPASRRAERRKGTTWQPRGPRRPPFLPAQTPPGIPVLQWLQEAPAASHRPGPPPTPEEPPVRETHAGAAPAGRREARLPGTPRPGPAPAGAPAPPTSPPAPARPARFSRRASSARAQRPAPSQPRPRSAPQADRLRSRRDGEAMRLRGCRPRAAPASSAGAGDARLLAPPGRNPFVHELRLSALQKAQVALMTLTLFPVRLLVAAAMMLLAWPLALVASLGSAEKEPEQPLALWRKVVDFLLKAIMRTMWFAGGFHRVAVKGRQALPTEAAILTLAPHSSYFDAIPVTMTMSSIVMKAESRDIPIWGTLIRYIRPVFVSRSDQDSRRKTVEEIKRRAQSNGKWPQIMIFPEGTCTNRTCLITFKPGAFIPGAPVQPVVLRYPNKLDTITWTWQGPGALEILWLTLCQFHNQVEIEFLPVYSPSEEEKRSPALYASNVRRVMAEALGVSVTDYTFEDCQLALAEGQLRLPADTCLLEFARLVRGLGLKPEKLEKDLDKYSESARKKGGEKMGIAEFAASLEVPVSDLLEDMFSLFDECHSMDTYAAVLEEPVTRQVCVEGSFSLDCPATASWDSPCDSAICALHQYRAAVVPPRVEPGQAGGLSGQRAGEELSGQGDSGQRAGGEEHPEAKEGLPGWREQEMRSTQDGKEAAPRVCRA